MLTNRRLVLSCLLFALAAPACGGRSGLDDFSKGADDIITGSTSGAGNGGNNGPDTSDGGSEDGDGGQGASNGGSNGNGGSNAGNGDSNAGNGGSGGSNGGGSGDAPVGASCAKDSTCEGENAECLTEVSIGGFLMIDFPKGYCAVQGCEDDGDCPDGSGCFNALGMQVCLQTCDRDRDCRVSDGYTCTSIGGGMGGFPGGGGGGGGGEQGPSYCLPPFGGGMGGFPMGN